MKLFNTLTKQLEEFKPIKKNKVLFYHCGPTVYWVQHIGNLRGTAMADFIRRSFLYLEYQVKFVRNYTDVGHLTSDEDQGEDKMEKGVKREGLTPWEISNKYIKIYENDSKEINILLPNATPQASKYIVKIIEMIQTLLNKGFAYITDLAIIYDTSKFPDYNKLNRQKLESNIQGAGKGQAIDPGKKNFFDFNLWVFKKEAHKNALQTWPSPWGEGFPGWHIECSAMVKALLGDTIDVHMGGIEHISVHHTNEIAQSEAANGVKFVNYWLHNEHLLVDGKKMSKSEGTTITLENIISRGFNPLSLRYLFLNSHYRSKQNFTWESLNGSQEGYKKLKELVQVLQQEAEKDRSVEKNQNIVKDYQNKFLQAVSNDFQIPKALATAWEMLKSDISPSEKLRLIFDFDSVFGLKLNEIKKESIPWKITTLAEERKTARENKDFTRSDQLRRKINSLGYSIEDIGLNSYQIKKL